MQDKMLPLSPHLQEALELIDSVEGKILTLGQRQKYAVELAAHLLIEANRIQTPK